MNKEYTYNDGKVIVLDEKGEKRVIDYYDNLEKVLRQENLIEVMEHEKSQLEEELKDYDMVTNADIYLPFLTLFTSPLVIAPVVARLYELLGNFNFRDIETKFGTIDFGIYISLLIASFSGIIGLTSSILNYREKIKETKIIASQKSQLEFIKRALLIEKEALIKLKEETTNVNENKNFRVVKLDNEEDFDINIFYDCLELSFNLVYYLKKYQRAYEKGNLEQVLEKQGYNENGFELVKHYLDNVIPNLVKQR